MSDGGKSIVEGMRDALAWMEGDKSRGKAHRVRVADTDVARVRKRLGLSQDRFALAFGVSVGTIRNWEQGRRAPEGPAKVLLRVIEENPAAVMTSIKSKRRKT